MKIIFLDIDGVLNSKETLTRRTRNGGLMGIDPYLVALLNPIILETDAQIVLSSSWRHSKTGVEEVQKAIVHKIIGITPTSTDRIRGGEIKAWLDNFNKYVKGGSVESYAILDDDSDMLPEQQKHFFQTSWEEGLTKEIADRVIKHLNKDQ